MSRPQSAGGLAPARETRKETIASRISGQLREAILRGALEPGQRINLDLIRGTFQVSLSPLREAMSRLVADGLVQFEDQRGYRVTPVSAANLEEVTRLRMDLESLALRYAIEAGDIDWESDVVGALHRLNRIGRDAARPESVEAWEAAHAGFHLQLIRGCGMPLLLHFCTVLHNLNDRYRRIFLTSNPGDRSVRDEHQAIADAAVGRRADEACKLLRRHIERTGANVRMKLAPVLAEAVAAHAG